ncbi:hypothetical protein [Azotobacter chroococcum]|uniref:hypothetical protein n=1 Tax=Azotobacter chroococcum TaxID=353 RepID=UPI0010AEB410|nr:hypothetical protein [Azotobacter chroococcum]TKD44918.1 hypothetical protein FCG41_05285 [Azotobacter chroococcum]
MATPWRNGRVLYSAFAAAEDVGSVLHDFRVEDVTLAVKVDMQAVVVEAKAAAHAKHISI